ncbi:putative gamma-tubulin complex component GCP5 [Aspergillus affinis]|uniref:putative gamma-tubulin complex component GCP5 n=1 Tax=Aspergillus affinis TaxID=1070780 RepID=UPI0022FF3373|nr:uncharacterized protein KD926_006504 [Aspergillus affinis]KAI9041780.1 hypothetical protein KD926_006504 [Aspergillus affinis]
MGARRLPPTGLAWAAVNREGISAASTSVALILLALSLCASHGSWGVGRRLSTWFLSDPPIMAVAATIGTLTDELVATVAKLDTKDTPRFRNLKRRAEETFKSNHARTNQFAVASQLDGLQEKFQVINKDDLADALRLRLTELNEHRSSWSPEFLSLLLQLADRPAQLSSLDRIEQPMLEQDKSISWNDLDAAGSAFCDEDIWETVDFGAESSDDDLPSVSSAGHPSRNLPSTSIAPDEDYVIPDDIFSPLDDEDLILSIKSAQFWRDENNHNVEKHQKYSSRVITELQVLREAIFMLQGLPTSIFWRLDDSIEVDRRYKLAQVSDETFLPLLRNLCSIGARVDILRRFIRLPQTIAHLQTFRRAIEDCLHDFDGYLSTVQSQYLSQSASVAVSLLQLSENVHRESRLLLLLADIVSKLKHSGSENPVRCLDLLYDLVCMAQATGYDEFRYLAKMFFSCFETYARPMNLWMETGELKDSIGGTLFILDNRNDSDLRTLWHDWYTLDEASRLLSAPKFIQPLARKIFITGKSTVFLQHLNVSHDQEHQREGPLTFDDVFPEDASSLYLPFSAMIESAFGKLVNRQHTLKSSWLRQELDQQCGLWASLEALEHIYLCKDMSVVGPVDNKIFELIDRGKGAWNDRYLLTDIAQSAFSALPEIDPSRLIVRSNKNINDKLGRHRSVKILETISFDYILPWPVANIITKDAILGYRRLSTFLMQIRRAMYMIQKQRLQYSSGPDKISGSSTNPVDYVLRHNMLWFLNTLYGHMTGFVVSTAVASLRKALDKATDVDAMIAAHRAHMVSLEDQCLLSKNLHALHQAILTLLDLCVSFADLQATKQGASQATSQAEWTKPSRHDDDDDEDSDASDADEDAMATSFHEQHYNERLHDIKNQFDRLVSFMTAGLKGVGRVDGQLSWEILAEKLEWRKARSGLNGA